jgi:hypothetical protein
MMVPTSQLSSAGVLIQEVSGSVRPLDGVSCSVFSVILFSPSNKIPPNYDKGVFTFCPVTCQHQLDPSFIVSAVNSVVSLCILGVFGLSIAKPTRCTIFKFIECNSTCFGRSFRPSSGVQGCTNSIKYVIQVS